MAVSLPRDLAECIEQSWREVISHKSLHFCHDLTGLAFVDRFSKNAQISGAWGSVVVKELRYKSEGPGIDSPCRRVFFSWQLTGPCALDSTQPLKMSARLILGVKAAGA
jgi:hypothetical protein